MPRNSTLHTHHNIKSDTKNTASHTFLHKEFHPIIERRHPHPHQRRHAQNQLLQIGTRQLQFTLQIIQFGQHVPTRIVRAQPRVSLQQPVNVPRSDLQPLPQEIQRGSLQLAPDRTLLQQFPSRVEVARRPQRKAGQEDSDLAPFDSEGAEVPERARIGRIGPLEVELLIGLVDELRRHRRSHLIVDVDHGWLSRVLVIQGQ
mmetsp:Transcript_2868/g.6382  ORF Transcript_2868/g.6382 Transcript_2868/m.6382 type:complete len:202 (-) Transcript_2868:307-912(-)